jgi:hypothetical protein
LVKKLLARYRAKRDFSKTAEPSGNARDQRLEELLLRDSEARGMHGGWVLIRMRQRQGEKRTNWLLIKHRNEFAREGRSRSLAAQMELRGITKRLKADHKSQDRRDESPGRCQTHHRKSIGWKRPDDPQALLRELEERGHSNCHSRIHEVPAPVYRALPCPAAAQHSEA